MPPALDPIIRLAGGRILAPRCQARAKRSGLTQCRLPAVKGKRVCRVHGGRSTGPRTFSGKAAVAAAHLRHGKRSKAYLKLLAKEREEVRILVRLGVIVGLIDP